MATLNDLFGTTASARLGIKRLGGAALAAIAGGVLLSGGALAQTITQPAVFDFTPTLIAPGDLQPGDTLQVEFTIASPPITNVVDTGGGVLTGDGAVFQGLSTSVGLTGLGTGGTITTFSGTTGASFGAATLTDPNCDGTGPSRGASVASWSGMSPGTEYFSSFSAPPSCTVAVTFDIPSDIAPGAYTLSFADLTGVERSVLVTGTGFGTFITTITSVDLGAATAFSTPLNDVMFTVVADTTGPSGTITAPSGPVAPSEVFGASVVFDESIVGFDASDLVVANGTVSNFVAVTNEAGETTSFTFDVTAGTSGTITIDVGAGAGQDAAGNDNAALTQASLEIAGELTIAASFLGDPPAAGDTTSVRFTIQNTDDTETGDITFFTSNLQEELSGLAILGSATTNTCGSTPSGTTFLTVTGGSVAPSASCIIEFDVLVPIAATPGSYRVATSNLSYSYPVAGAGVADADATQLTVAGAEGAGAPLTFSKSFTDDPVLPGATVTLEYTIVPEENTDATDLAFTDDLGSVLAGLAATGLPQSDVCGTGSTLSGTDTISLSGGNLLDGETCTFSVTVQTPTGSSGDFVSATAQLTGNQDDGSGSVAIDTGFIASDTLTLINQVPQVTIAGPAGPVAVGEDFTITIEFSEPVTGFLVGEIDTSGGVSAAVSNLQTSDNEVFTATINPSVAGTVVVALPAGVAQDADTNDNVAATNYTVTAEVAAPEIAVQFVGASIEINDGDPTPNTAALTDFGTVDATSGQLARTVTISNTGVGELTIASITVSDNANYTLASIPTSVAGGGSATFTITYDPTVVATHAATVTINSDDADEAVFDFAITGTGGSAPEINVAGNSVNIPDGTASTDASDHTQFVSIAAGASGTRTFTIENVGGAALTLGANAVSITNDTDGVFSVTAQPATSIASSGSETFTVQADPATPGVFTALVSIASDDADENPYTFAIEVEATGAPEVDLRGNGVSIVSGDATPTPFDGTDMGPAAISVPDSAGFTIFNTGNADLVLTSPSGDRNVVVERQSGSSAISVTAQPAAVIAPGAFEFFTIQYAPTTEGTETAVFGFSTNDADEPLYTFTVSGDGERVTVSVADVTANEGDGTATVTVSLAYIISDTVSVDYATSDDTAEAGSDYTATSGTVTIGSLSPSATFTVPLTDDAIDELDEALTVTLTNPVNANLDDDTATVTLTDNDDAPTISIADITPGEGDGTATFTVSLDAASGQTITVDFATADGTATAGSDYTTTSGTLTFNPGDTSETVAVTLADDALDEADETFVVDLSSPTNATIADAQATGTITDNDATPSLSIDDVTVSESDGTATFSVSLDAASGQTVAVDFATANGTAQAGSDFTANTGSLNFAPGDTTETITVTITDDALDEATETFTVDLSNATNATITDASGIGTVNDDDDAPNLSIANVTASEGDGTITFTVSLDAPSGQTITVTGNTNNIDALAGSDYVNTGVVTFTFVPGDTSEDVTVTLIDDALDETDEQFFFDLGVPVNATATVSSAIGTITDNDATPSLSIADVTVGEGDGTATLTVSLDAASGQTVTVDFATADGTATAGSDYTINSGTLTFAPGDTSETLTVTLTDDALDEAGETFTVDLSTPNNATIADASATATITDNDAAPSLSIDDVAVAEGDGTATFTVSLAAASGQTVSVDFTTSDGTATAGNDFTASSGTLTLNPGDTSDTVTVSITDDLLDEASETFTVDLSNPTNATISDTSGSGTITDNDDAPIIDVGSILVDEGDGTATLTVSLRSVSGQTVTVDAATSDSSALAGSDYVSTTQTLTFAAGEQVKLFDVSIIDDALDEADEAFEVTLSNPTNATVGSARAAVTIGDNDDAPELIIADVTVSEADGTATFTVTSSAVSAQTVTVDFATSDGTAEAGSDYTATTGTATINAGDTTADITVTITDDGVVEADETYTVNLSNPANATITDASATGTINNDDAAPIGYTASFDADPINDAGASSASFTFASAVVGTTYDFTISSDGGGADVTGSGSVTSASQQVSGIDVAGLGDGTLTLSVFLTDVFGNEGLPVDATATKETTLPSVAITTASADPVSGAFTVTFTFSEDVTGFAVGDIVVGNGVASGLATTSASVYTATITPTADGSVTVDVAADVAQDGSGNGNTAATQFSIESDSTAPDVAITTASSDPVSGAFEVTFTFTEDVTGFAVNDITVGNGAASGFSATSASVYTATITPAADGTVTVDVAAGAAQDDAANLNTAADQFSIESDGSAPTVVSVVASDADVRIEDLGTAFTLAVTFSEAVDPAVIPTLAFSETLTSTLTFESGAFSDGNTVYTATYTVVDSGESEADLDVTVGAAADPAGNVITDSTTEDVFSFDLRRGGITVVQNVLGLVDAEFDFSGDLGDFTIITTGQSGSQRFNDLAEGVYAFTLADEDGFSITDIACLDGTTSVDLAVQTATVTLAPGDRVECSFEATADAGVDENEVPQVAISLPSGVDDPTTQTTTFTLTNTGGAPYEFTAITDQPWISVDPNAGTIPASGQLEFTVAFTDAILDLAPGDYTANIIITQAVASGTTSVGGSSTQSVQNITIPVSITLAPREGTLTLIATTAPAVAGEGVFSFSSDITALDGLTLTTVNGTASSDGLTVLRGSYDITQAVSEGWRLDTISCTGDTDGGSTFDVANGTATIDLDPEETLVCTFANRRDEDFIREVTQSAIRSFMAARADQILTHSPDVSRRLRGDRAGSTPNSFSVDMTENRLHASMSTSLSAIRQAASERENRMPDQEVFSLDGATGAASLDVWFEASYSSVNDDRAGLNADTEFGMYAFGVDMMANESVLVGALVQFDQAETVTGEFRSQVEGDGWLAGPYMAARLSERLVFDARVAWGQSDNQVNPIGTYWDDFETDRWMAEANLVGDWVSGGWRISPELGIAYFAEEQAQYTDSLGFVIPSQEITLGRITAGPEIAYRFETEQGGIFEPFVKVTAVYDYDDTEVINLNGALAGLGNFRADARIGLAAEFANGGRLSAEAGLSGLGEGDFEANTAMIRLRLPLSLH